MTSAERTQVSLSPRRRRALRGAVALIALIGVLALVPWADWAPPLQAAGPAGQGKGGTLLVQLLAFNDFHGNLETLVRSSDQRPIGGAAVLAAYLDAREAEARAQGAVTLRVAAGDLIGATPLPSAFARHEPTIEAMDLLRLRFSSVGNHEFDRGAAELRRLQYGGCVPDTPIPPDGCFRGARFRYLAANVFDDAQGAPLFPPYVVEWVQGVPIGFIGIVLRGTPEVVMPSGVAGLRFLDEADTINQYTAELKQQGVRAIVVLIHQGGEGDRVGGPIQGPIVSIVERLDPEVDVIVSGHTHRLYRGEIAGRLVTQSGFYGQALTDIRLSIDRQSGDVVARHAMLLDTWADQPPGSAPDAAVGALVARAVAAVAPFANRPVGVAAELISRTQDAAGESALGDLIADAQRATTGTQVAFMNPGGIRADLPAGPVTYGDLFDVQPFGNNLVTLTLTGAQIVQLLEQQWIDQPFTRFLQPSGLTYTWRRDQPVGQRVDLADVVIGGEPLRRDATYTVTVNDFLADGGDNFSVLRAGANRVGGPIDLDALVDYLEQLPQPFMARLDGRIQAR